MTTEDAKGVEGSTTPVSLLKRTVRYVLHVFVFYQVVKFSTGGLANFVYATVLPEIQRHPSNGSDLQFLFSHVFAFTLVPSFLAGLVINARFRHGPARWVWIFPVAILLFVFVFSGTGIYPTMVLDSNFGQAFHHFFGTVSGIPPFWNFKDMARFHDWWRVRDQFRYTMPAYAGIAYSLGAWLGMDKKSRALQVFLERL